MAFVFKLSLKFIVWQLVNSGLTISDHYGHVVLMVLNLLVVPFLISGVGFNSRFMCVCVVCVIKVH